MAYFTQAYIDFFKGLSENNNKDWFDEHRKIYEKEVKDTFKHLVQAIIDEIPSLDQDIAMATKDAVFRINRDIRFSKDKTPYNTIMKAGFARGGRRSSYAGYYLGIDADHVHVGGGVFGVEKEPLEKIRNEIAAHPEEFLKLVQNDTFVSQFGGVMGEKIKRIPKEFQEVHEKVPLIANKQFYYMAKLDANELVTSDKLLSTIMEYFKMITPINRFLKEAIS